MTRKKPVDTTLELRPDARFDVVDMRRRLHEDCHEILEGYPRTLYVSHHTTAGYLDGRIAERLGHDPEAIRQFVGVFRKAFPPQAGYHHDQLERRTELTDEEKVNEPLNADSHLTFISAGLVNCLASEAADETPVWWVELDGTHGSHRRLRRTTVIGYHDEEAVDRLEIQVPVASHGFDSVNLRDPELGVFEQLQAMVDAAGIRNGRIDLSLGRRERAAGLVVNEYETLLMKQDLKEVLGDPLRYVAEKGRHMLANPRSIPGKTLSYARYDVPQVLREAFQVLGLSESVVERLLGRLMGFPASRFLRMKQQVALPVVAPGDTTTGTILQGTYQSPILVQWNGPGKRGSRALEVRLVELA